MSNQKTLILKPCILEKAFENGVPGRGSDCRLKRGSKHFEVLVEPEGALAYKRGEEVNLEDILAVETIFEDANRGDRAAESDIINSLKQPIPLRLLPLS